MDRNGRHIRDEPAVRTKNGTAKVETFTDVKTNTCLLKCAAHLFRDTAETMSED